MHPARDLWEEDKEFPRSTWRQAVMQEETQLGYWDWVEHEREADQIDISETDHQVDFQYHRIGRD